MASDDGYQDGRGLLLKRYTSILYKACIPFPFRNRTTSVTEEGQNFTVKGAELYYMGRGENQNDVLQLQVCHITVSLSSCIQRS